MLSMVFKLELRESERKIDWAFQISTITPIHSIGKVSLSNYVDIEKSTDTFEISVFTIGAVYNRKENREFKITRSFYFFLKIKSLISTSYHIKRSHARIFY